MNATVIQLPDGFNGHLADFIAEPIAVDGSLVQLRCAVPGREWMTAWKDVDDVNAAQVLAKANPRPQLDYDSLASFDDVIAHLKGVQTKFELDALCVAVDDRYLNQKLRVADREWPVFTRAVAIKMHALAI